MFRSTKCELCFCAGHQDWYQDIRNVVPVINSALHREGLWENGGLDPCIRNSGIIWKRVANFTPWAASSRGKRRRNGLNKRAHRPQSGFGSLGEERAFLSLLEIGANFSVCPASSLVTVLTELFCPRYLKISEIK